MKRRITAIAALALAGALVLAVLASFGAAGSGKKKLKGENLSGYLEVPAVSSDGKGKFQATIKSSTVDYKLTYSGLGSGVSAAHIHFGQRSVNGGVAAFLCGGGGKPACPTPGGTVAGTIVAADVIGPNDQGIGAAQLDELIAAMRAGRTYVNVHTASFGGGEIRGQINDKNQKDD